MITLTDWKDTVVQRVGRDMVAVLPVKLSLRHFHRCMEQSSWDNLHGPLPGALSPVLGCNPKRSSNRSLDGDIPYSPLFQATMLPPACMAGRCCPYCAIWRAELS